MCLNAARLPARVDDSGNLSQLYEHDRTRWDRVLIAKGEQLLDSSATGADITDYHIEAAIASLHARAGSMEETDWPMIVSLYDRLLSSSESPIVALNRALAIAQFEGAERGLAEIAAIDDLDRLADYPFYFAAMGELEQRSGRAQVAHEHFLAAAARSRNAMERHFFERRALETAS